MAVRSMGAELLHADMLTDRQTWRRFKVAVCLKNKNQLDATHYFIVLLTGSTCFGHYYAHHQELG